MPLITFLISLILSSLVIKVVFPAFVFPKKRMTRCLGLFCNSLRFSADLARPSLRSLRRRLIFIPHAYLLNTLKFIITSRPYLIAYLAFSASLLFIDNELIYYKFYGSKISCPVNKNFLMVYISIFLNLISAIFYG